MARERFKSLRATGDFGGHVADFLTVLMTNWPLVIATLSAISTGLFSDLRNLALTPTVYVGVAVFLVVLWTIVGITALIDRRRPRVVQAHSDYRYGLTLEGFVPTFVPENGAIASQRGSLGFSVHMRNYSPGPIKYTLESAEIQIGTRAIPKYKRNSVTGYMARGGGKLARVDPFPAGSLKEFYGKGETKGTADISITYGPPDEPPVRRLKFSVDVTLFFPEGGNANPIEGTTLGYADSIIGEEDEPFKTP